MSKSLGNFFTVSDFCKSYSSDGSRIVLANAGDTIENANISLKEASSSVLKLFNLEQNIKELCQGLESFRTESTEETKFFDDVFQSQLNLIIQKADEYYNNLVLREVIKEIFYNMNSIREEY